MAVPPQWDPMSGPSHVPPEYRDQFSKAIIQHTQRIPSFNCNNRQCRARRKQRNECVIRREQQAAMSVVLVAHVDQDCQVRSYT